MSLFGEKMKRKRLNNLEIQLGYSFENKSLLVMALTHSSYAHESQDEIDHNQRLEFLGDAVLEFIVSSMIYDLYPDKQEGDLTRLRASLVCEYTLFKMAKDLFLDEYILLGQGESQREVRPSILADCFESVVASIYLDGGIEKATLFIESIFYEMLKYAKDSGKRSNYKTELQEKYAKSQTPIVYTIVDTEGPEHECIYTSRVRVGEHLEAFGKGRSKKEAEQEAAKKILEGK